MPTMAPLPIAFAELQRRLFDTLELQPEEAVPEQCSLRFCDLYPPSAVQSTEGCYTYNHAIMLTSGVVAALRHVSSAYSLPFEVVLLTMMIGALLRTGIADADGRLVSVRHELQRLTMTMYSPMRDGAANEAMIGLFSDWRDLTIEAGPSVCHTVLGLAHHVLSLVRERSWKKFDGMHNTERMLVNFLPLDEKPRGPMGFQQTRRHEGYYVQDLLHKRTGRGWRKGLAMRPMRLTLEQYVPSEWWLTMDLGERFPPAWCRRFAVALEHTVLDMVERPLVPLL